MIETRKSGKQHFIIVVAEGVGNSEHLKKLKKERYWIKSYNSWTRSTWWFTNCSWPCSCITDGVLCCWTSWKGNWQQSSRYEDNKIVDFDIQEALSMKKHLKMSFIKLIMIFILINGYYINLIFSIRVKCA